MHPGRFLSLPAITAVRQALGGHYDGSQYIGVRIGTHNQLDDFLNENGIEVASEPSIPKKVRATVDRLNGNPSEHSLLRKLIEQLADPRYYNGRDFEPTLEYLNSKLRGDNFELVQIGDRYRLHSTKSIAGAVPALREKAERLSLASVQADFDHAIAIVEEKPDGAIRAACATLESVCKCLLEEMGKDMPNKQDITSLMRAVADNLKLTPGRQDIPADWDTDVRQILSGLYSVVGGIGALRTHAGDAHGKGKRPVPADARIARLAIHAASTVGLFYIETWQRMQIASK